MTNPDIVDLRFPLGGQAVPLDYADALWQAVRAALPGLENDPFAGIHHLHGLSPGGNEWYLSRRSRLVLRLMRASVPGARTALEGACLRIGDRPVEIGAAVVRELAHAPAIYAHFVAVGAASAANEPIAEDAFLAACQEQLAALDMRPHNMVPGKAQRAQTPAGLLSGFSLMLTGLNAAATLTLQRQGLGGERKRGCGIFVPHKSIAAVGTLE